jgi:hypothetical protein
LLIVVPAVLVIAAAVVLIPRYARSSSSPSATGQTQTPVGTFPPDALPRGGDKFVGKWKQKGSTGMVEIKKASGSTYTIIVTDSSTPGPSSTLQGTKQGDTLHIKDPGGSGAEITLRPVSGGLEMKNGTQTITLVKQ